MKTRIFILAVGLAGGLSLGLFRASADLEVSAGVSIHSTAEFDAPLVRHGTWVEVGPYGHCWRPSGVVAGWRPYCDGYWEWTDCGWYWVSDEPWAWACYHYGTWVYDSNYGWVWIPGVEWAPAWVNWRIGGDYIGWVPCSPPGFIIAPSFFVFVESRHFHERVRPGNVIVNNTLIFNKTTESSTARRENRKIDGREQTVMVNDGPHVDAVEKATGKPFTTVPVREADRRTSASIPKQFKRQATEPGSAPNTPGVHKKPVPAPEHKLTPDGSRAAPNNIPPNRETPPQKAIPPDRTTPRVPPEKTFPPPNKESPSDKQNRPPKEINPPPPSQTVPSSPAKPSEKDRGNENKKDDKDHGHDNP